MERANKAEVDYVPERCFHTKPARNMTTIEQNFVNFHNNIYCFISKKNNGNIRKIPHYSSSHPISIGIVSDHTLSYNKLRKNKKRTSSISIR